MATPQKQVYTEADYYALPEDVRAELIDGQIYYHTAPSRVHQKISGTLYYKIRDYIESKNGTCEVYPCLLYTSFGIFEVDYLLLN